MQNLKSYCTFTRVNEAVSAGTSAHVSTAVDCQEYGGVAFLCNLSTATNGAVVTLSIAGATSSGASYNTYATDTATVTSTGTDGVLIAEVWRPKYRWNRASVARATQNSSIAGIHAIRYAPMNEPASTDATVRDYGFAVSPST